MSIKQTNKQLHHSWISLRNDIIFGYRKTEVSVRKLLTGICKKVFIISLSDEHLEMQNQPLMSSYMDVKEMVQS